MRLMDHATGTEVVPGSMLRPTEGLRRAWRFESITCTREGAMIHASATTRSGRVHRHFHPHMFGLNIEIDVEVSRREHVRNAAHVARAKMSDYMLAGLVALVPLAFFEHYDLAGQLFEAFGGGGH